MKFDMIGKKYGRLTVLDQYYKEDYKGGKRDFCLCQCDCGGPVKEINGKNIRKGMTTSCGCVHTEKIIEICKKYNKYDLTGEYGIGYFSNSDNIFYFDKEDYELIKNFCWHEDDHGYASSALPTSRERITLQNLLLNNINSNLRVDHINRIRYDCRKINLRLVTHQQNNFNRGISSINTSGVSGVSPCEDKWESYLGLDDMRVLHKLFDNFEDAVIARLKAEKEYFGEYAPQQHLFKQYGID
jgi:hypothetical protein